MHIKAQHEILRAIFPSQDSHPSPPYPEALEGGGNDA